MAEVRAKKVQCNTHNWKFLYRPVLKKEKQNYKMKCFVHHVQQCLKDNFENSFSILLNFDPNLSLFEISLEFIMQINLFVYNILSF